MAKSTIPHLMARKLWLGVFSGRHFASLLAIFAGPLGIKRLSRTSPSQVMIAVLNSGDLSRLECLV